MDNVKEIIKLNFCQNCSSKCDDCMQLVINKCNNITSYKCNNYCNNIHLDEYKKHIKFDFHDDSGNFIAIIKPKTPLSAIIELRKHYDFVRNK